MVAKKKTSVKKKVTVKKKTVTKKKAKAKTEKKETATLENSKLYTEDIADEICSRLSQGEPLRQICRDLRMPGWVTVYNWCKIDDGFSERIARARNIGFDSIAEDCLHIADGRDYAERVSYLRKRLKECDDPKEQYQLEVELGITSMSPKELAQRDKLRVDTRLKLLSKWDPKRYGDKLDLNHGGQPGNPVETVKRVIVDAKNTDD